MNEDKNENNPMSSLHTLEGDLLASMKDENYGSNIVKIVTQGKGGQPGLTSAEEESSSMNPKTKKIILGSVASLLGIAGILYFTFNLPGKEDPLAIQPGTANPNTPSPVASTTPKVQVKSIFEADIIIPMQISDGVKSDFIFKINEAERELLKNKIGDKLNISFVLDTNLFELFDKLQYSGPDSLARAISQDQAYNFGVYHVKGTEFEKYLLMKVSLFDLGFSGMLEWEKSLPIDLERIFTFQPNSSSTVATMTAATQPKFVDKVIKNIDTRTYIDEVKGVRVTYGFINRQYLLITSGENAFVDIVNKLLINNILR